MPFRKARSFAAACPGQALSDLIGLTAIAVMILVGFTVPALL